MLEDLSALVWVVDAHATKWETDEFVAASQEWIQQEGLEKSR